MSTQLLEMAVNRPFIAYTAARPDDAAAPG
jgi:hypothetical protein